MGSEMCIRDRNTTATGVPSIASNTDLPIMTATQSGAVPTPPNDVTKFLRGDGTFAIVPDNDLLGASKTISVDTSLTANYSLVMTGKIKINSGIKVTINTGATLRIL